MISNIICSSCKDVFSGALAGHNKNKIAERLSPVLNCTCHPEYRRVNTLSPAHVADDEQLAVCACHPHHFHDDGTLGPEAVDLAYTCGMSVSRLGSDCDEQSAAYFCEVNFTGVSRYAKPGKPSKPGKKAVGIAVFTAGDARRVVHTDKSRAYSVFDTAREDQPEHADVVATKYFGAREDLPVDDQAIRLAAQLELLEKMEVKFSSPYTKEMLIKGLL